MTKTKAKTIENSNNVIEFIKSVPDNSKQKDSLCLLEVFKQVTGFEPKMWGPGIIGFGNYHYKYESGHEGDAPLVGFSPRKQEFSLYLVCEFEKREDLLKEFGKHKTGKACIYFKKVDDINIDTLKKMITLSIKYTKNKYQ